MSYEQLESLRNLFVEAEAERERLRSESLVWRVRRATVALLKAHSQRWHRTSRVTETKGCEKKGERIRVLCALLVRSENPRVTDALAAQLRQAIEEYVRSANLLHRIEFPISDTARDRQSSPERAT